MSAISDTVTNSKAFAKASQVEDRAAKVRWGSVVAAEDAVAACVSFERGAIHCWAVW